MRFLWIFNSVRSWAPITRTHLTEEEKTEINILGPRCRRVFYRPWFPSGLSLQHFHSRNFIRAEKVLIFSSQRLQGKAVRSRCLPAENHSYVPVVVPAKLPAFDSSNSCFCGSYGQAAFIYYKELPRNSVKKKAMFIDFSLKPLHFMDFYIYPWAFSFLHGNAFLTPV